MDRLNHFDSEGRAQMVDISAKTETLREAVARAKIIMAPETLVMIREGKVAKGDVLGVARVAGIMAAKKTAGLIPMCHPLAITGSNLDFRFDPEENAVHLEARVKTTGKTGVEMEALTAVTVAALTIYDMCKAVDRAMVIQSVRLIRKSGGKSGTYTSEEETPWAEL